MKTTVKMQETVTALAAKHDLDLREKGACLRLDMPHYDRLVIEVLHPNLVSVAHIYEPRPGVNLADPGIVFFTGSAEWVPVEIGQRIGGYRIYAVLSEGLDDILSVLPREQADLASFAEMWADNIRDQGWLDEGVPFDESVPF